MNKATRILAIAGMALAAGATIGASPAMASSSTTQSGTTVASQSQAGDRIVDYFRSYSRCDRAGDIGEWANRWDDHDCYRVRFGFHRGWYALSVDWDNHGHNNWHGNSNWHGNNNNWHGNNDRDHRNNDRDHRNNDRDHRDNDHRDRDHGHRHH
jgi:hypothetical protein